GGHGRHRHRPGGSLPPVRTTDRRPLRFHHPTREEAMTAPQASRAREYTGDPAISAARTKQDIVVGDRLVRFRWSTRALHWLVALTFVLTLFTGLPIWTPVFGWLAYLFGGLQVVRWLHPWFGIVFSFFILIQFIDWVGEM